MIPIRKTDEFTERNAFDTNISCRLNATKRWRVVLAVTSTRTDSLEPWRCASLLVPSDFVNIRLLWGAWRRRSTL